MRQSTRNWTEFWQAALGERPPGRGPKNETDFTCFLRLCPRHGYRQTGMRPSSCRRCLIRKWRVRSLVLRDEDERGNRHFLRQRSDQRIPSRLRMEYIASGPVCISTIRCRHGSHPCIQSYWHVLFGWIALRNDCRDSRRRMPAGSRREFLGLAWVLLPTFPTARPSQPQSRQMECQSLSAMGASSHRRELL